MNSSFHRLLARIALIGAALVLAFGLAGCGRKSGLDLPPAAAVSQPGPGQPGQPNAHVDAAGRPVAPPASEKKSFILDWLID